MEQRIGSRDPGSTKERCVLRSSELNKLIDGLCAVRHRLFTVDQREIAVYYVRLSSIAVAQLEARLVIRLQGNAEQYSSTIPLIRLKRPSMYSSF